MPWPHLRLWRSNTAPNQHQQDWSVLVSPAGAWLLRWHVVRGRKSLGSVCCWWYPKLLVVPQLGCRARFCKLLSVHAASSSWHGLKITESLAFFFFPFFLFILPFSYLGQLQLITFSNLHSVTAMATISTCSS